MIHHAASAGTVRPALPARRAARLGLLAALGAVWLLSSGCGISQYRIVQAPSEPLHRYHSAIFEPIVFADWINGEPEERSRYQPYLMKLSPWIPGLASRVCWGQFRRVYEPGEGVLQVQVSLIHLEPGSRWLRTVVSQGVGRGAIGLLATLVDSQSQEVVGSAEIYGTVTWGWFGGSLSRAYKNCGVALGRFLLDHTRLPG